MRIVCSWCKKFLGEKEPFDDSSETHAKCPTCIERQKHQEEIRKAEESRVVTIDGFQGLLTLAGKESPKVSFWEIDFSGKQFFCSKETRKNFEKYIKSLPSDEVAVTWLHSSKISMPNWPRGRGRRKKIEPPPKEEPPKSEDYNCTIRVSKEQAFQVFDSASERNIDFATKLMGIAEDWIKKERIWIDEETYLLPPTESCIPTIVKLLQDKEIYDRTLQIPYPYTEKDGKKFVKSVWDRKAEFKHTMEWGIYKTREGLIGMIGFIGKSKDNPEFEELGYWLGKPYWRQGIMTKALKKLTEHGFNEYKFKRLEMRIFSFNEASCRLAEKCGYKFEKLIPAAYQKDGKSIDAKLYAMSAVS